MTAVGGPAADASVIHLFEPSGYAGVFQHCCRLAQAFAADGRPIVLHTSSTHEPVPLPGVEVCTCVWWPRPGDEGAARATVRRVEVVRRLLARSVPHLIRSAPGVVHVQGVAATGAVNLLTLQRARHAGHRVVYSPHDVFSRRGAVDGALLHRAYGVPDGLVVYSRADAQLLTMVPGPVAPVHVSPLIQVVDEPAPHLREQWRTRWGAEAGDQVVLFAGWIRPEKRLDVLIEAARTWPVGRRLAVVGPDRGGWARCAESARQHGVAVSTTLEFVELAEFTAAIAAADVVVVPSEMASQSGVLAVARRLGTPTVAADVGGMGELATRVFPAGDARGVNRALAEVLDRASRETVPATDEIDEAVSVHLRAYGMAA